MNAKRECEQDKELHLVLQGDDLSPPLKFLGEVPLLSTAPPVTKYHTINQINIFGLL